MVRGRVLAYFPKEDEAMRYLGVLLSMMLVARVSTALAWPGCEEDRLAAVVAGDTLTVQHDAATYNCCMDSVTYSVTQTEGTIEIREAEALTDPCTCLCCYNVSVQVEDLAAGDWTLVFIWYDYDTDRWEQWAEQITVLDVGQSGSPVVISASDSGCIDPSSAPASGVSAGTWGRVKSLYR
jgi:hypothetical protein